MKQDFLYESSTYSTPDGLYCAQILVTIKVSKDSCSTPKGTQELYSWELVSIYDEDNKVFRNLNSFSLKEQAEILKKADYLADGSNYEAYLENEVFYVKEAN